MCGPRLRALCDWVIRRKPRCTGWGHHYLAQIRRVVMVFICKNYQYSVLITKAWVPASPATIWYFQLYFTVTPLDYRQGKFLLIVTDTSHYRSDIWNLNIGKYLPSQSPYLSGLLRGQEMLSCGQRNEDILTQPGTCHTDKHQPATANPNTTPTITTTTSLVELSGTKTISYTGQPGHHFK